MSTVGSRLGMPYTAMSRNRSSPNRLRVAAVDPRVRVLDAVGHHPQRKYRTSRKYQSRKLGPGAPG